MLPPELWMPSVLVGEQTIASVVYLYRHNPKMALYWLLAATITAVVTF
jgi:hypothetical protein